MPERIGFVGLGIMGWPMAENLVQAGYDLTVHNRTKKKAEEFAKNTGAQLAESPREV
ncbi:MAG: NAD(P)-binding domain-containing protein, partial [Rubrobacteraceae bacterium]|nr:NAD(P)-binding domain-containing protein [Rubrobacteraceae bacterium]